MTTGAAHFVQMVADYAGQASPDWRGSAHFVLRMGEEFAFIRLADLRRPGRFLRQMAGAPPTQFGAEGFDPALVDDRNPVRHYTAFVVVGFWLPATLALALLIGWEILGFVRYGGQWSQEDMRSGLIGLRHGRRVRQYGARILPKLIQQELATGGKGSADAS